MIPRKRNRAKMGLRERPQIRSLRHLRFVRARECAIRGKYVFPAEQHICRLPIQAAHIRVGTDGGGNLKPSDSFTIPLCVDAHIEQGKGERTFEKKYGLNTLKMAADLWQADVQSRMEWERKRK